MPWGQAKYLSIYLWSSSANYVYSFEFTENVEYKAINSIISLMQLQMTFYGSLFIKIQ